MAFYDYQMLSDALNRLENRYPFIQKHTIGKSVQGRDVYAIGFGEGKQEILFVSTHLASDYLLCAVLMHYIEDIAKHYVHGTRLCGYSIRNLFQQSSVFIIPMVNPDGVEMVLKGFPAYHTWKANARGVDLEHNYDASWEKGKMQEREANIYGPCPFGYGGRKPESEPEVIGVANFIRRHNIQRLLSFQTGSNNIFWTYRGIAPQESEALARQLEEASHLTLSEKITYGSCKDWFIKSYNKPGYTIAIEKDNKLPPGECVENLYKLLLELFLISSII